MSIELFLKTGTNLTIEEEISIISGVPRKDLPPATSRAFLLSE